MAKVAIAWLSLGVALGTTACGAAPFTKAVGTYTEAAGPGLQTVSVVSARVAQSCSTTAKSAYLQARLDRVKGAAADKPLPTYATWTHEAEAMAGVTWDGYCTEISKSAEGFTLGVHALGRYSDALSALAKQGGYDGASVKTLVGALGSVRDSLSTAKASSSKVFAPIANQGGVLASLVAQAVTESDIKKFVIQAKPTVTALIDALVQYLDAVDAELAVTEQNTSLITRSLEGIADHSGGHPQCPPPTSSLASDKGGKTATIAASVAPASPRDGADAAALANLCAMLEGESLRSSAAFALVLYGYATTSLDDAHSVRATMASYKSVLGEVKAAHQALADAGSSDGAAEQEALKTALSHVKDLFDDLAAFQAATATK